ncbi:MAG: chaperone modulatory protein CbpM [Paracoccaceae bacterium]|jgi:chaperone modulatory protein CbpM
MTERFTQSEALCAVARLTEARLTAYLALGVVRPYRAGGAPVYRRIDIARLDLICELSDTYELEDEALAAMLSLLDQLHAARRDLRVVAGAAAIETPEVAARIAAALIRAGGDGAGEDGGAKG